MQHGRGPPTPEPGGGGRVASLPAGPLLDQLVTFPGRPCVGSLLASPGQGLAGVRQSEPQLGASVTQPRPPRQLFLRRRTQPSVLHAPLIPPKSRLLWLVPHKTWDAEGGWKEVGAKQASLSCWSILNFTLQSPFHTSEVDSAGATIQIWV